MADTLIIISLLSGISDGYKRASRLPAKGGLEFAFGSGCFCDDDHEDYEEAQQQNDDDDERQQNVQSSKILSGQIEFKLIRLIHSRMGNLRSNYLLDKGKLSRLRIYVH